LFRRNSGDGLPSGRYLSKELSDRLFFHTPLLHTALQPLPVQHKVAGSLENVSIPDVALSQILVNTCIADKERRRQLVAGIYRFLGSLWDSAIPVKPPDHGSRPNVGISIGCSGGRWIAHHRCKGRPACGTEHHYALVLLPG